MKSGSAIVLAAAACLLLAAPASARRIRHHVAHAFHDAQPGVMRDVLVANPYGDVIIDGSSGFHRSDVGTMVPDTDPPSVVAVGRASRSGLGGANGLPGFALH